MTTTGSPPGAALPQRAVDAITHRLSRRRLSRRGFLTRAALVGSALAVDPTGFLFRPRTAYASVCGDDTEFRDGWSAFCATINDGANTCPPYSYAAGWWKIDNSTFCSGRPRYIVDCNRLPDESCRCHAADGECDHRRVCCNNFRYGQCNTQIKGTTEVVCRIVICTPPWRWDPACTRTSRTANETRTHWSAALPPRGSPTPIKVRWLDMGLNGSVLGAMSGGERHGQRSGRWARFRHGVMTYVAEMGTRVVAGPHADVYADRHGAAGRLGYPLRNHLNDPPEVHYEFGRTYRENGTIRVELYPFRDVPATSVFFTDIMWLAAWGITKGCNPPANDRFCPERRVTRGQMAAFLVRALGLTETSDRRFRDVPKDHLFAVDINKLATAGITKGCNPPDNTRFCPDEVVSRQQMAALLVRAMQLSATSDIRFRDVPRTNIFWQNINQLATAGITKGCNPPDNTRFCPEEGVSRQQMAAFLHRAL